MKIYKSILYISAVIAVLSLQSCDDSENTDNNFLYAPKEIVVRSSSSVLTSLYTYDMLNRIIEIQETFKVDSLPAAKYTKTDFTYSSDNNLSATKSNIYSILQKDTTLRYSETNTFTYAQLSVSVSSVKDNKTTITTIELDDKKRALKKSGDTGKFITYEYEANGNLKKTTDQNNLISEYTYDNRRGIFREVNLPAWYINIFMDNSADTTMVNIGEFRNIRNNCVVVRTTEKNDSTTINKISSSYSNTYGGFGYPTSITNNSNSAKAAIIYTAIK